MLSKLYCVTPNNEPNIPPNHVPTMSLKLHTLIKNAYIDPSTPSLHPSAALMINGMSISCWKNDSATPSHNTTQKYGNIPVTTSSCVH